MQLTPSVEANQAGLPRNASYKVVADTSVLISSLLSDGKSRVALRHIISHQQLIVSEYIIDELIAFLKDHTKEYRFLRMVRQKLEHYAKEDAYTNPEIIRDPNDTAILMLAIRHQALLVTGDKDLISHQTQSPVLILSVEQYLNLFTIK